MKHALSLSAVFLGTILALHLVTGNLKEPQQPQSPPAIPWIPPSNPQPQPPTIRPPQITTQVPDYLNNEQTVAQLKKWNEEAPDLTEVGAYGKTRNGKDIHYIRIEADHGTDEVKPIVLITACIHGNEPLSASTVMGYIGTILGTYGKDQEVTKLVDSRIMYFVPIVSPDSYPRSRHVDGVDPNRDFPTERNPNKRSVPPVQALRDFFLKIKPHAVISGHTYGRVYLTPWGDKTRLCKHDSQYKDIIGKMGQLSRYRLQRACEMYNRPIYGTEVDWYYKNGAFSIVMEFGTHQRIPSRSDIRSEFDRTYKAALHFIQLAPEVRFHENGHYSKYRFPLPAA